MARHDAAVVHGEKLRKRGVAIGFGTFIAPDVKVRDKNTVIGKYCSIASGSHIGTGRHPLDALSTNAMVHSDCFQKEGPIGILPENRVVFEHHLPVRIGNDVWIGLNAVIMDGVSVGDGAVIGTGAIVTRDVPPYAIVAGVPARIIKYRFDEETIRRLVQNPWFERDHEFVKTLPMGDVRKCLEILEKE